MSIEITPQQFRDTQEVLGIEITSAANGATLTGIYDVELEEYGGPVTHEWQILLRSVIGIVKFAHLNPQASSILRDLGYSFQVTPLNKERTTVEAHWPPLLIGTAPTSENVRSVAFAGNEYTDQLFVPSLRDGDVLISTDGSFSEAHDSIVHRPAWELLNLCVPGLIRALRAKAEYLAEPLGKDLPPTELQLHQLTEYMWAIDDQIDLSGSICMGMSMRSRQDPEEVRDALNQTIYGIGLLFMNPRNLDQHYDTCTSDYVLSAGDMALWAEKLHAYAGRL